MPLIPKPNYNQIFASQAPDQDKPAVFNNYPEGWGPESRPNNGKPTIKGFNYLQQTSDLKDLWILQNGACLPYDESIEYAEGAPVLRDGVIQYKTSDGFKSRDAVTIPTYNSAADGVDPVTGVADGAYFNVRSSSDESYVDEYQNTGGVPTPTGKSYPSSAALNNIPHNNLKDRDVVGAHPASAIVDAIRGDQQSVNDSIFDKLDKGEIYVIATGNAESDTGNVNAAITLSALTSKSIVGRGDFKINQTLNMRSLHVNFSNSSIELIDSSAMVRIGGASSTTINKNQSFGRVFRRVGLEKTLPTLRMEGSKDQFIHMQACDYLQIYADTTNASADGSIAYCTFNLGKIDKLEITNNPANTIPDSGTNGGAVQWINENHFDIQRCSNFIMSGTYHHNHNHFYGGVFEGASTIKFLTGRDNYFHDIRFEGSSATVEFAADTERNTVLNTWDSSIGFPIAIPNVTDNGFDNNVIDDFFTLKSSVIAAYTDISKPVVNNLVNASRAPQLQRLLGVNASSAITESEMIPAVFNDWYRWVSLSNNAVDDANARYKAKIEFYDSKLNPVTASADFIYTTGGVMTSVSGNSITSSGNVNAAYAALLQPALTAGVRFVKVKWLSNNPITAAVSNAQALYVTRHSKLGIPFMSSFGVERPNRDWIFTAKPTQGFVPMGASGFKSDGTEQYICTFTLETSISSLSGVSLVVTSATGVQVGDIIGINLDDLTTHWTTVSAISGSSITLSDGVPSASSSGSRVVFNRWVTK